MQTVKNLPAIQETQVQALCWEDALEKSMGTHSSILAQRIPQTEQPGGLQSTGSQRVRHTEQLTLSRMMQRCLLTSLIAQSVKDLPAMLESLVRFLGREDLLRRDRLPTAVLQGVPGGSAGKESACNVGDLGSIPGLGKFPGEGKSYPLQDSGLENSMGTIVHGVTKSRTRLSNFHFRIIQRTDPHQLLKDLQC